MLDKSYLALAQNWNLDRIDERIIAAWPYHHGIIIGITHVGKDASKKA